MSKQSNPWDEYEEHEASDTVILNWAQLEPFTFGLIITDALPSEQYDGYQITGRAFIKTRDAKDTDPFLPNTETEVKFFTKTAMESRFRNLHGDSWATEVIGRMFSVQFRGLVKSNQGRDMYGFIIMPVDKTGNAKQSTLS